MGPPSNISPQCRCIDCKCNGNCRCADLRVELACDGCTGVVEEALRTVEGVEAIHIDIVKGVASVSGTAVAGALLAAVETTGRTAHLVDEPESTSEQPATVPVVLRVEGMTCSHCSSHVQTALADVEGVTSAAVNLESGIATIDGSASAADLIEAVESIGKKATVVVAASQILWVQGMMCLGCSATIKRALSAVDGIHYSAVDVSAGCVVFSGGASATMAKAAIEDAGHFKVVDRRAVQPPSPKPKAMPRLTKLVVKDMVCNGCKKKVELVLGMLKGVVSVDVELDTRRVVAKGTATSEAMFSAIAAAGYEAEIEEEDPTQPIVGKVAGLSTQSSDATKGEKGATKKGKAATGKGNEDGHMQCVRLLIDGMTCASCVSAIEGALVALNGVTSAAVSLMANSGQVDFDSRLVEVPTIVAAVSSIGYRAEEVAGDGSATNTDSYDKEARRWKLLFFGASVFTVPVFTLSMVLKHMDPFHDTLQHQVTPGLPVVVLILWILTTPVQVYFGLPFHRSAVASLRHGESSPHESPPLLQACACGHRPSAQTPRLF